MRELTPEIKEQIKAQVIAELTTPEGLPPKNIINSIVRKAQEAWQNNKYEIEGAE